MKRSSSILKSMARQQLTGKYSTYIAAILVYYLITMGISFLLALLFPTMTMVSIMNGSTRAGTILLFYIIQLLFSLIFSIFTIGFLKMYLDGSRGYPVVFSDLFYGFRHHPDRVIVLSFLMGLLMLVCLAPGYILLIAAAILYSNILIPLSLLCLLAGMVVYLILSMGFSQSYYLLTDYDDLNSVRSLRESWRLMKGNKGRYFRLQLSYLGLLILAFFSCGLALLWVTPYIAMTNTLFYRELDGELDQIHRSQAEQSPDTMPID